MVAPNMRTALVGGASKGLGLACARSLASRGHRVIMCARTADELQSAARSVCLATGADTIVVPCDFSSKASLDALQAELAQQNLPIEILINNVGGPPPGRATETSEIQWEKGLDLLFRSTLRLYGMALPGMRERKWGRIINILSTTAVEPAPTLAVSSVLRSALTSYAKLVSWDVAWDGVTVNSVLPGGFRTARTEALEADAAKRQKVPLEAIRKQTEAGIPIGRLLEPFELGEVVAFLASEEAGGVTGAILPVDGGLLKSL
jgi:3-oxoacyl-[acyl-carrier protein] reductase